uniref:Cobalamin synthesis G N-terminal n=1 Tax=Candidatus Kentrum sp. LPFa TaxID=2126335 RepID=A0A450WEK5_9GAMM|nr:MAG: Cobalamin synthesis G N-terminal [Candidatus Kentron sp. LPFa]VFK30750.1 MAG: Cobalamin synthesis G N-terminal [Candidatus Kentron sp. LPFa]
MNQTGTLYGVSLGPGDPGLITRRAWALLESDTRTWPVRSEMSDSCVLGITEAAGLVPPVGRRGAVDCAAPYLQIPGPRRGGSSTMPGGSSSRSSRGTWGGANAWARELAKMLDATAVITTASDVNNTLSVDILGRELGWRVEASKGNITRASAHVVNGEPVAFAQEAGSREWWPREMPLPSNIHLFQRMEEVDLERFEAVLWVTEREIDTALTRGISERLVVYRP